MRLDLEALLRQEGVIRLNRLVMVKLVGERLQEWVWLYPEGWRQLVRLMDLRDSFVSVFQEQYEYLRL